jgi:hypothetical protein
MEQNQDKCSCNFDIILGFGYCPTHKRAFEMKKILEQIILYRTGLDYFIINTIKDILEKIKDEEKQNENK